MFGVDDALLGALVTGGSGLIGSLFASDTSAQNTQANIQQQQLAQKETEQFNAGQADISRQFNADEAAKAREFSSDQSAINRSFQSQSIQDMEAYQTQMSNTAYQRSRADMVKAGLNPILAATSGGASSPSGGSASGGVGGSASASGGAASVGTPNMALHNNRSALQDLGDNVGKVVSSAISMKTFEKLTQEIANLQAQQAKTAAETETEKTRPEEILSRTALTGAHYRKEENLMPTYQQAGRTAKSLESIPGWLRDTIDVGSYGGKKIEDMLGPLFSSAKGVKSLLPSRSTSETTHSGGGSSFTERFNY